MKQPWVGTEALPYKIAVFPRMKPPWVYYSLGEVLAKADQLEEAISCYRRALVLT